MSHIVRQPDRTSIGVWGLYQLKSAFQPIFAFSEGRLKAVAFEGLIRPTRDGQAISPGEFFATFTAVERFHIETLTRTLHFLNAAEFLDGRTSIFVNFDPRVFTDQQASEGALRDMRLVLHESGIDPERVVCELTENQTASEEALQSFVQALRDNGFRIAVDDYGADDSDINRIRELRPDIVKFDSVWISRLMDSSAGVGLLKAMVGAFKDQGIQTIFEGLEESWQLDIAETCGVSMVQGYIVARPQTVPADFSPFLQEMPAPNVVRTEPEAAVAAPIAPFVPEAVTAPQAADPYFRALRPGKPFGRRTAAQ